VEARVLEGARQLDNGLANILDLLLVGHLVQEKPLGQSGQRIARVKTHHHLDLVGLMGKLHGDLEKALVFAGAVSTGSLGRLARPRRNPTYLQAPLPVPLGRFRSHAAQ
jgi:hypothetical protein